MRLEQGLVAHLEADGTLTALVGTRIYPEILPQDVTYPCIRYARIATVRSLMLDGVNTWTNATIQIDVWGMTYASVKAVGDALRDSLDGVTGNLGGVTVQRGYCEGEIDLSEIDGDRSYRRISYDFAFILHE